MKALLLKFLQSKAAGRPVPVKNADGSVTLEEHDCTSGSVAATVPSSDVATLVGLLGMSPSLSYLAPLQPPEAKAPKAETIAEAVKLIHSLADVEATRAMLDRLSAETAAALSAAKQEDDARAAAQLERAALQEERDAQTDHLAREQSRHDRRLADDRRAFEGETAAERKELERREAKVAAMDAEYVKRFAALEKRAALYRAADEVTV